MEVVDELVVVVGDAVVEVEVRVVEVVLGHVVLVDVVVVGGVVVDVVVVGGTGPPGDRSFWYSPFTEPAYTYPNRAPLLKVKSELGATMLMAGPAASRDTALLSVKLSTVLAMICCKPGSYWLAWSQPPLGPPTQKNTVLRQEVAIVPH